MGIRVTCKACETSFSVADDRRGKKIRCKECEEICVVPSGGNSGGASNGKRKRDADDERSTPDDDERPRSKKAAKGGNLMLPLALGGGAVVLVLFLLCGGGGAAYFLFFKGRPAPAQDNQPIAAAPDARDKQAEKPAAPPDNQPVAPAPANKKIDEKPVTVPLAGGGPAPVVPKGVGDAAPPQGKEYTPKNKRFTIVMPPGNSLMASPT